VNKYSIEIVKDLEDENFIYIVRVLRTHLDVSWSVYDEKSFDYPDELIGWLEENLDDYL
jgi:hypothetical protein